MGEFNDVAKQSTNANVKTGFSLEFVKDTDGRASKPADELPKTLFRANLIPKKVSLPELLVAVKKLAPRMDPQAVTLQMKAEGGIGGRTTDGVSAAFASTSAFEEQLLLDAGDLKLLTQAGLQLGGLIAHELGHAMGINKNQGKGLMIGTYVPNLTDPTAISNSHFEPADKIIILATLEGIAKAASK